MDGQRENAKWASSIRLQMLSEFGRRPLRSSTDRTLTVPRTHNRFGDRGFAVACRASFVEQFAVKSAADL